MQDIFGAQGVLKEILPYYEYREEQLQMADYLYSSLDSPDNILVEAGTGIGKTLAYLVPTIKHCIDEGKVIAVSTETKALQKQLLDKDIPLIKKILNEKYNINFKASLCLGSSNYPCRRRYEKLIREGQFLFDEQKDVEILRNYFDNDKVFTVYDVDINKNTWNQVRRDSETCNQYKCPYRNKCLFLKVKKEWADSTVLIMNHYLFFSNVYVGKTYLPHFDMVVFDEAHAVEQIASHQLGFDVNLQNFEEILRFLYSRNKKAILSNIVDEVKRKNAMRIFFDLECEGKDFFTTLHEIITEKNERTYRLTNPLSEGEDFTDSIKEMLDFLKTLENEFEDDFIENELDVVQGRLFEVLQNLNMVVYAHQPEEWVYWIEKNDYSAEEIVLLRGQPIDIAEIMNNDVYAFYEKSIFVSATLAINKDFAFIKNKLGLNDAKTLILESPFDYKSNVTIYLPPGNNPAESNYTDVACMQSAEIIKKLNGRCLILFTSYQMLNNFHEKLQGMIDNPIFSQGEINPVQAVAEYQQSKNGILLGTHSFWQGLDLPGDLLRGVIITRLPFSVPDLPDIKAKIEKCEKAGINPFMGIQVPGAVIKFKQGFGRLIRRSTDKGVVAVLDSRIITKRYGKMFIESIPECGVSNSLEQVAGFIDKNKVVCSV